jgi:phage FluMu protein Com
MTEKKDYTDSEEFKTYPCWNCKKIKELSSIAYLNCKCPKLTEWKKKYNIKD